MIRRYIDQIYYLFCIREVFPFSWEDKAKYEIYLQCENIWWQNYFHNIFLPNINVEENIQLVFWESCPEDLENYAFDIDHQFANNLTLKDICLFSLGNSYLSKVCKIAGIYNPKQNSILNECKTRQEALTELSRNNWLIIDLYPTHGITLKSERKKLVTIFDDYTIPKLEKINAVIAILKGIGFNQSIWHPSFLKIDSKKEQIRSALELQNINLQPY